MLPPDLLAQDMQDALKCAYYAAVEPPVSARVLPLERHEAIGRIRTRTFSALAATVSGGINMLGREEAARAVWAVATADRERVARSIRTVGAIAGERSREADEALKRHLLALREQRPQQQPGSGAGAGAGANTAPGAGAEGDPGSTPVP